MKLICMLTGCPSPGTYFSLPGPLSPASFVKLFEQQVFSLDLYTSCWPPTHACLLLLFDLSPPGLDSICLHWPVLFSTGVNFSEKEFMIYPYKTMPHSIFPKPSIFLVSIPAASTESGISELLKKFFMEWVSELFPLDMLPFCLYHPHFIHHSGCCYLSYRSRTLVQGLAFPTAFQFLPSWPSAPSCSSFSLPHTRTFFLKHQRVFGETFTYEGLLLFSFLPSSPFTFLSC